jgi:DNA (cytosine-5)-methyltransferase 1
LRELIVNELLPTPAANDSGNTPEDHLRKKPGRQVVTSLMVLVDGGLIASGGRLLPTPTLDDAGNVTRDSDDFQSLTRTAAQLLPTPTTQDGANTAGPSQAARNTPPLNWIAVAIENANGGGGYEGTGVAELGYKVEDRAGLVIQPGSGHLGGEQ